MALAVPYFFCGDSIPLIDREVAYTDSGWRTRFRTGL